MQTSGSRVVGSNENSLLKRKTILSMKTESRRIKPAVTWKSQLILELDWLVGFEQHPACGHKMRMKYGNFGSG